MSNLQIEGVITKVSDVIEGTSKSSGKSWKKLTFVIQTSSEYPKNVAFTVFGQEKVDNFVKYNKVGQNVEVSFNVESREYNDRYYTDLQAWKVFSVKQEEAPVVEESFSSPDDLPF